MFTLNKTHPPKQGRNSDEEQDSSNRGRSKPRYDKHLLVEPEQLVFSINNMVFTWRKRRKYDTNTGSEALKSALRINTEAETVTKICKKESAGIIMAAGQFISLYL